MSKCGNIWKLSNLQQSQYKPRPYAAQNLIASTQTEAKYSFLNTFFFAVIVRFFSLNIFCINEIKGRRRKLESRVNLKNNYSSNNAKWWSKESKGHISKFWLFEILGFWKCCQLAVCFVQLNAFDRGNKLSFKDQWSGNEE